MIDDIKRLVPDYESLTPKQIAEALQTSGVTHRHIDRADLVHWLNMRGMLRKLVNNNDNEKWTGTVLNMQDVIIASGNAQFIDGIRLWFSHVTNQTNLRWDTTLPEFAAPYWAMVQAFADQPTMPTADDFEFVASLGGGWKYAVVTAEQVEEALEKEQRLQAVADVARRNNAAVAAATEAMDNGGTPTEILSAAEAAWTGE